MIRTCEANQMRSARMITGEPHRLHHSFGARHVKRDFVKTGNLAEPANIVRNHRVGRAEHWSQRMGALFCVGDAILVKIVAEDIDAVGAGQVVKDIAIDVGDGDASGGLHEGAGRKMLPHHPAVLKGHPKGLGESQVGDPARRLCGQLSTLGVAFFIKAGESLVGLS